VPQGGYGHVARRLWMCRKKVMDCRKEGCGRVVRRLWTCRKEAMDVS
jgi:hypothetical protein